MTDFLQRLEAQLIAAAAAPPAPPAPPARPARRASRARRLRLPVAVMGSLLATATIALAAAELLTGSPVPPAGPLNPAVGEGVPAPGGSRLLPLRVADPGGGLPWGMRVVHTTRGLVCLQVGRVQDGVLGELGIDGAFHDDGRFHPLPANVLPADASVGQGPSSSCQLSGQTFSGALEGLDRNAATTSESAAAPGGDEREISYGLLGPHAASITYDTGRGPRTVPVLAGTGAYLLVQRVARPVREEITGGGVAGGALGGERPGPVGALTVITYRFGRLTCADSVVVKVADPCPRAPVAIEPPGPQRDLHEPLHVLLEIRHGLIYGARLRFSAPYAVTSAAEGYEVASIVPSGCRGAGASGAFGPIDRDVARGAIVRVDLPYAFANACGRSQPVEVLFDPRAAFFAPRARGAVVVGRVTLVEPPGTRPATPPLRFPHPRGDVRR